MVFFKGKKILQVITYKLYKFQHKVNIVTVNHHLQFNMDIWINNKKLPPSNKRDKVHIHKYDEFHLQYLKMSWSPEGDL